MKIYSRKSLRFVKERKEMEDTVLAKALIKDIGGDGYVYSTIAKACDILKELFPHYREPRKQWTERRLWA